jgi:hypothetical protein
LTDQTVGKLKALFFMWKFGPDPSRARIQPVVTCIYILEIYQKRLFYKLTDKVRIKALWSKCMVQVHLFHLFQNPHEMVAVPEKDYTIPFIIGEFLNISDLVGYQHSGKMSIAFYPFGDPADPWHNAITNEHDPPRLT